MTDALTLTAAGRQVAYQRTGDPLHLCRLITAADHVLARDGVPPGVEAAATDFRQEARDTLGARPCEAQREPTAPSVPTAGATTPAATEPRTRPVAPLPGDRAERRRVRAGVGTLVPGLLLFAPVAGLLAYRADGEGELAAIRVAAKDRMLSRSASGCCWATSWQPLIGWEAQP